LDQQGYIKNRYLGYNIRQIQDMIDYTETLDIDGVILFLDFKKAFATVEWDFMINVLRKFGFKNDLINWVNTLYKIICSSVINNGWKSDFFRDFTWDKTRMSLICPAVHNCSRHISKWNKNK